MRTELPQKTREQPVCATAAAVSKGGHAPATDEPATDAQQSGPSDGASPETVIAPAQPIGTSARTSTENALE